MPKAYPQGRPQEDPRVPLPWYVNEHYPQTGAPYPTMDYNGSWDTGI